MDKVDERLFDARTVERHIAAGRITREQYETWLASLDDEGDDAAWSTTRMSGTPVVGGTLRHHEPQVDDEEEEEV